MTPSLLLACAYVTRVGLVEPTEGSVHLRTPEGSTVRLELDEESAPLLFLQGAIVEVEGPRVLGTLHVEDWTVRDAGTGTGGFVGLLRAHGSRLVIEDRNTGTTILLEDGISEDLRPYVGKPVLVVGTVVGGNMVRPIAWRVLAPE